MLAFLFQSEGGGKQRFLCTALCGQQLHHLWLTARDRSGLIEGDDLHPSRFLKRLSCFEQNTVFRTDAATDHDGNRRRKPESARTTDDENGNAPCERISKGLPDKQPDEGRDDCDADHGGDEYARDPIRNFSDRCFCR